jgi:hypothetical protein
MHSWQQPDLCYLCCAADADDSMHGAVTPNNRCGTASADGRVSAS